MNTPTEAPVKRLIDRYEAETLLVFKPSRKFYENTGINRVRFAQLANGDKRPMLDEANNLVKFFSRFFSTNINDLVQWNKPYYRANGVGLQYINQITN